MHLRYLQQIRVARTTVCVVFCIAVWFSYAAANSPTKFDEFEDLSADDQQARLDQYAKRLTELSNAHGFIVFYRAKDFLPGWRLREVYGFQGYLVNKRGVDASRLTMVDGGVRETNITQLWLAPAGATSPQALTRQDKLTVSLQFDSLTLGYRCVGEYTLVLEKPDDALRFFAAALRESPGTQGFVLVHPATRGSFRDVTKLVRNSRSTLATKYQLTADRIISVVESPRSCAEIDLWLAPPGVVIPKSTSPGPFFQSQLMSRAEREQYAVRRIELLGNTHTRDNIIRRRLLQNEGDTFRRRLLEQSLRSVSKLRQMHPVTINDVEVHLNEDERTIDFLIYLWERSRSRSADFSTDYERRYRDASH